MAQTLTLVPSAQRLMESLRDIGYDLPTAIADVVDNSVEARATEVRVDLGFAGVDSWVSIADNGRGMPAAEMDEALRYGTRRFYDELHLGKFGLGLKTASLSQCRRLTVATRCKDQPEDLEIRRWDLDHIVDTDAWEVLKLESGECRLECTGPLRNSSGTVVLWEGLDRVLNYRDPLGGWAREGFARLCREVEEHLAMVFHRFLSGKARRKLPLSIAVNGNAVGPWDPFARFERSTQVLDSQKRNFRHDGRDLTVTVSPYILPPEALFSSKKAWDATAGPKKWNRQQGFYIYRADRMIQSGGWNRLRTVDEHTKLARIAIDFSPRADAAFKINVAKMSVQLPEEIRKDLAAIASAVARRAEDAYRRRDADQARGGEANPVAKPIPTPTVPPTVGGAPPSEAGDEHRFGPRAGDNSRFSASAQVSVRDVAGAMRQEFANQPDILIRVFAALLKLNPDFAAFIGSGDVETA